MVRREGRLQMRPFSAEEEQEIQASEAQGPDPACPRGGSIMETLPILASQRAAYVRARVRFTCHPCRLTSVVDQRPRDRR